MSAPTAFEQELLEYLNRARANPQGEYDLLVADGASQTGVTSEISVALRYFDVDLDLFRSQIASLPSVAPLAWNSDLEEAAHAHDLLVLQHDYASHQFPGEKGMLDRFADAGYDKAWSVAENVYAYAEDMVYGHAGFYIDWGNGPGGIQDPAGHRLAMLRDKYTEVGIDVIRETDPGTNVGPYIVTQDFGLRDGYAAQLLGVVIEDADGDRFYDAGEGLGGVTVTASRDGTTLTTTTWDSGGYQMVLAPGTWDVSFAGGGLDGAVTGTVTIGDDNVKLDAIASDARPVADPPMTLTGSDAGEALTGGTADDSITGGAGADWITPGAGSDSVDGGDGVDMISFVDLGQRVAVSLSGGEATSGDDTNRIANVENITGSIYSDLIEGDAGDNYLRGMGGYDWFIGSDGADSYEGSNGRDMISYVFATERVGIDLEQQKGLFGQAAGDVYDSIERATGSSWADLFYGSGGEDEMRGMGGYDWFMSSGGGRDRYDGGSGRDTVSYAFAGEGVTASLSLGYGSRGEAARDLYTSIENLTGTNFDDILTGDNERNILRGQYGRDILYGNGGTDYLTGGGSDDVLYGGDGWDVAVYEGNKADYTVFTAGNLTSVTYNPGGGDGMDLVLEVEALRFADDMIYL